MPRLDTDLCADPGCEQARFKPDSMRGRSRFCEAHYRLHDKRYRAHVRLGERVRPPKVYAPESLTPGELLLRWSTHPFGPQYGYQGRRVYGMTQLEPDKFRLILAGQDGYEYVDGSVPLRRMS